MVVAFRDNVRESQKELLKLKRGFRGKALKAASQGIGKQGVKELKKAAPKGEGKAPSESPDSKRLKDSFSYKVSTKSVVRFISSKIYAVWVSKGTKPSTGGYVPSLKARLKKKTARARKFTSQKMRMHPGIKGNKYIKKAANQLNIKAKKAVIAELRKIGFIKRGKVVVPKS